MLVYELTAVALIRKVATVVEAITDSIRSKTQAAVTLEVTRVADWNTTHTHTGQQTLETQARNIYLSRFWINSWVILFLFVID